MKSNRKKSVKSSQEKFDSITSKRLIFKVNGKEYTFGKELDIALDMKGVQNIEDWIKDALDSIYSDIYYYSDFKKEKLSISFYKGSKYLNRPPKIRMILKTNNNHPWNIEVGYMYDANFGSYLYIKANGGLKVAFRKEILNYDFLALLRGFIDCEIERKGLDDTFSFGIKKKENLYLKAMKHNKRLIKLME